MEMIVAIFRSLGVDESVKFQFVILMITFIGLSTILFSRVRAVLDLRESKTTKLEGTAHAVYKKAEELSEQYSAKIEKSHQESHINSQKKKQELLKTRNDFVKDAEAKLAAEYESKKTNMLSDYKNKREKSLAEVDGLSNSLIEKLTK